MFLDACQSVQNESFLVCACERYLGVCEHYFVGRDRLYSVSVCESFFFFIRLRCFLICVRVYGVLER